jgi:hypothetical protein
MKQKTASEKMTFTALIEKPDDGMDTAYVSIPFDVNEVYGTRGQVKVRAMFDNHAYSGSLVNMGTGCHVIILRKDVRQAIGKQVGDQVKVEITKDTDERVVDVPEDLKLLLSKKAKAKSAFDALSFTNKKEYVGWINQAKKAETRAKRVKESIEKLLNGKKNPSQK